MSLVLYSEWCNRHGSLIFNGERFINHWYIDIAIWGFLFVVVIEPVFAWEKLVLPEKIARIFPKSAGEIGLAGTSED